MINLRVRFSETMTYLATIALINGSFRKGFASNWHGDSNSLSFRSFCWFYPWLLDSRPASASASNLCRAYFDRFFSFGVDELILTMEEVNFLEYARNVRYRTTEPSEQELREEFREAYGNEGDEKVDFLLGGGHID
jgi:hypothetical protein